MVNQVIKHLIITFCILTLLFIPMAKADSRKASEDETKLAKTIETFGLEVHMVWIKEANDWRILTIAAIDD